jgi:hypothetical protein
MIGVSSKSPRTSQSRRVLLRVWGMTSPEGGLPFKDIMDPQSGREPDCLAGREVADQRPGQAPLVEDAKAGGSFVQRRHKTARQQRRHNVPGIISPLSPKPTKGQAFGGSRGIEVRSRGLTPADRCATGSGSIYSKRAFFSGSSSRSSSPPTPRFRRSARSAGILEPKASRNQGIAKMGPEPGSMLGWERRQPSPEA